MHKRVTVAFVAAVLLWINHVSPQTQPVVTGSDIPDAAAWRIWLNQKSEVPGNHSEAFTTYLDSLRLLSPGDTAALQAALESYASQETALRTASNAKIDASDENRDAVTASKLQSVFQTAVAALVSATRTQLSSHLSANGATALSQFIQGEKKWMTISPLDATLAQTRPIIHYEPAAYHASGHAEDAQMGFGYSTYASMWMSVVGRNSNGEPSENSINK